MRVLVTVEGGIVQSVVTDQDENVEVLVRDEDDQADDEVVFTRIVAEVDEDEVEEAWAEFRGRGGR